MAVQGILSAQTPFNISPLKTSIHLSRSNGYRELAMYDESILELEEIEGETEERWIGEGL